jgi:predicted aspartyl protease
MSTKIRLFWETNFDSIHLARGHHVRIIRLFVPVSFKESTVWSRPRYAIVDTGSPLTLLPKPIWETIQVAEFLSEAGPLGGVGHGTVLARLAKIKLAFLSTQKEIVERTIKVYLAEDDAVPLLLGIEDLLTNARLVCDYPKSKAFLQF